MRHSSASTDSSPRFDVMTSPATNTWSPMSTRSFQAASWSSPTLASESIAWISVPSPARSVAKHSLPVLREKMTRPAMPTRSPVAVSSGRSGKRERTSAMVAVIGRPMP